LYLVVRGDGRRWVFRYRSKARKHPIDLGLGSARVISLAQARRLAKKAHEALSEGRDVRAAVRPSQAVSFGMATDAKIELDGPHWKNEKHAAQWRSTMQRVSFRDRPVASITFDDVVAELRPVWTEKAETARRVRARIEAVLDFAHAKGWITGDNPARLTGKLRNVLGKQPRKGDDAHHAAMRYADVPALVAALREKTDISARALEFTILTAARTGETLGATWAEIDLDAATWTIPGARMKAGREHVVPLSDRAIEILRKLERAGELVFPGAKADRPLSNMALAMMLRRLRDGVTVHGFRSSFRDWAGERAYPRDVVEAALAHGLRDKTEASYLRTNYLDQRRPIMDQWARFVGSANTAQILAFNK
jgi:integrase